MNFAVRPRKKKRWLFAKQRYEEKTPILVIKKPRTVIRRLNLYRVTRIGFGNVFIHTEGRFPNRWFLKTRSIVYFVDSKTNRVLPQLGSILKITKKNYKIKMVGWDATLQVSCKSTQVCYYKTLQKRGTKSSSFLR